MISMAAPLCVLCGKRAATYVCQDCGRAVCNNCFDPVHWSCSDCQTRIKPTTTIGYREVRQSSAAMWLFFIAFAMIFIGILLMTLGSLSNIESISGGAVILIGPIPIVFGTGPYSVALIALAAVLTIFAVIFFYFFARRKTR